MNSVRSEADIRAIRREVDALSFTYDHSGMSMASLQGQMPTWLQSAPAIAHAVMELPAVKAVMVNRLPAGTEVPMHTDAEGGARWHLPIQTNPDALWEDALNGKVHFAEGFWWGPVPYAVPHRVTNHGTTERIHLIVDCEEGK